MPIETSEELRRAITSAFNLPDTLDVLFLFYLCYGVYLHVYFIPAIKESKIVYSYKKREARDCGGFHSGNIIATRHFDDDDDDDVLGLRFRTKYHTP